MDWLEAENIVHSDWRESWEELLSMAFEDSASMDSTSEDLVSAGQFVPFELEVSAG